ncbi:MAG: hypothetical protein CME70_19430 [Halobacteriovorax sp.]|nr:hypothetical protein [Halobacteriovorax sp.]MBK26179.1 hypothetical protein [Halobacteriovorax sp.]
MPDPKIILSPEGQELSKSFWAFQIKKITNWLLEKGYTVRYDPDVEDQVDFELLEVQICSRSHAETRFYTMLHECGHILIRNGWKQFAKEHPMYAASGDGRCTRSRAYRVSLIAEEIDAWKRGRRLANRLDLFVRDQKYDKVMTECLMGYIEWAGGIETALREENVGK